ncbi:hypothetical protein Ddye_013877 [Dipteronia dyeriana]|uniref:Jacalin-type lectin domain-containing protein n=1 Tax=Dipteronia dyeriana TaxID=168575 RepID=A0AAD9X7A8_9ROSI|nr:hypothetical protein Ddye_013877 [Dipteronia dyeriana]
MAQENFCNLEDFIKVGPWGSQGGTHWSFKPMGLISEIIISHGWLFNSISFKSEDGTDNTIEIQTSSAVMVERPTSSKLGTSFNLPMEGGVIVGSHGRSSGLLDAIGVYVKYAADVLPLSCSRQGQMATNKVNRGMMVFLVVWSKSLYM